MSTRRSPTDSGVKNGNPLPNLVRRYSLRVPTPYHFTREFVRWLVFLPVYFDFGFIVTTLLRAEPGVHLPHCFGKIIAALMPSGDSRIVWRNVFQERVADPQGLRSGGVLRSV